MPSTFFTTDDGDVILRTCQEPGLTHDFRVHKFILSLASPVFKDMFTLPQPPDQNQSEEHQLPTIDVLDPPQVLDTILRFIYPGAEFPTFLSLSTVSALLSAADKYNIASMYPVLRTALRANLPRDSFWVYAIACRFGFLEEAKEAARVSNTESILNGKYDEAVQHISSTDLFRFVRFVQEREHKGRSIIGRSLAWANLCLKSSCGHWEIAKDFYFHLEAEVEDAFSVNPCLEVKDLFGVFDRIVDPPRGCTPPPDTAEYYWTGGDEEPFSCPLVPMSIRNNLSEVVEELTVLNVKMLNEAFGMGIRRG